MAEHEHEAEPDSPSSMDQELAKETGKMTVLEIKEEYTYVIPSFSVISKEEKTLVLKHSKVKGRHYFFVIIKRLINITISNVWQINNRRLRTQRSRDDP